VYPWIAMEGEEEKEEKRRKRSWLCDEILRERKGG
jgi:hypothetical protein